MTLLDTLAAGAAAGIAAVWLLYPAAIAVAARFVRRAPARGPAERPSVSVVLATRDASAAIRARIANLVATDARLDEVIVALDARAPAIEAELASDGGPDGVPVRVVRGEAPGKAGALNAGVGVAVGDVLVFADTHQRFERGTIPALLRALEDRATGIVSGALRLPADCPAVVRRYWLYERWLRHNEARVHSAIGVSGSVYAMRRILWRPLPAALILDDVYTPMRLVVEGHRVGFAAAAVAHETRAPSPGQEYGRKVRTLTGVMQLCAWLPAVLVPIRNPVWLQFVFHKLLRMLTPYAVAIVGLWAIAAVVRLPTSGLLAATAALLALAVACALLRPRLLGRLRHAVAEGLLLQAAVVVAGFNGVRGRWQVWDG